MFHLPCITAAPRVSAAAPLLPAPGAGSPGFT
jgi:hypothetical protein